MGTIDEVKALRQKGRTDQEIIEELKARGISEQEVLNSLSQSKIKEAIVADDVETEQTQNMPPTPVPQSSTRRQKQEVQETYVPQAVEDSGGDYGGMQPSIMSGQNQTIEPEYVSSEGYGQSYGGGEGVYSYQQYQPYQEAISSDVITEISEQVVSEKLSHLKDRLESVIDIRTVMEARMSNLNERLQRIEKILDQLQLSVLQKVGDYVNDVKDIKREMEETQKSFSAIHRGTYKHRTKNSHLTRQTHSGHHSKHKN